MQICYPILSAVLSAYLKLDILNLAYFLMVCPQFVRTKFEQLLRSFKN